MILQGTKLDLICDYMVENYPDVKPISGSWLGGQFYSRTFREKVQRSLGGKIMVSWIYALLHLSFDAHWLNSVHFSLKYVALLIQMQINRAQYFLYKSEW